MSNDGLVPILWNAPHEDYHLKPCNARHYLARVKLDAYYALPKHQQKRHIFVCKKCGGEVAWADSKSGTRYLCNVTARSYRYGRRGRNSGTDWYYSPADWHSKTCTPTSDGSVHPNAVHYEQRNARLIAERDASTETTTPEQPYIPTVEDVQALHDELVFGALRDDR